MSYKTNPIANRIKINKGWKNPYLPIKTLNYARDISLWFKVYLLLKAFLNLKKIQLVSYEIRFDQQNKKILYLRINKKGTLSKKRKKKKTILNKILKKIRTPLLKNRNAGSIFFLYKDLILLKNLSFWNKNNSQKKVLTKFWLTKPKISTWMNTLDKIMFVRQNTKKKLQFSKKNKNFIPTSYLKVKFSTNKQKQILAQLLRIKKKNLILNLKFFALIQQKKTKTLPVLAQNLKKEISKNQNQIQKLKNFYKFWMYSFQSSPKKKKHVLRKKLLMDSLGRKKLNIFWSRLKIKFNSFTRARFLRKELPTILFQFHKNFLKDTQKYSGQLFQKNPTLKKIEHLNFLVNQIRERNLFFQTSNQKKKIFIKNKFWFYNVPMNTFLKKKFDPRNKNLIWNQKYTKNLFYNISIWVLLRRIKKKIKGSQSKVVRKKLKIFRRSFRWNMKTQSYTKYHNFLEKKKFLPLENRKNIWTHIKKGNRDLKNNHIAKYYKYRLPYRRIHFNFQQLNLHFKLKYLIQDFVQKYFQIQVETKIAHVLNANKNKNFFRLVFSVRKKSQTQLIKKQRLDSWNQKQMFLISRLKLITPAKIKTQIKKKKRSTLNFKEELVKSNTMTTLKKKAFFILAEKKRLKSRMRNYFSHVRSSKDFKQIFKYFMPTLIEFSRSFDPQLLADLLAKVILKSKKQTKMLNNIKQLLQSIQLPKNIGYKIVLSGRINSKKKSRLIYITKNQVTLQVFNKNMNYAYSQANARIGAFGIKIWVYSKKNRKNEKNNSVTSKQQI